MVESPLPPVGQEAPVSIRLAQIEVNLVVRILIGEWVATPLRSAIQIEWPLLCVANGEGSFEELVGVDVRLRVIVGIP